MRGPAPALLMGALLALYLVLVGVRAVMFLGTGQPLGVGIGVALLVLPLLGAWALVRELLFGMRATRLLRALAAEEALPTDELPRRPSGRVDRAAAERVFDRYAQAVERDEGDWRAWLRLGLVYDASGDRRRARAAVRRAVALERG